MIPTYHYAVASYLGSWFYEGDERFARELNCCVDVSTKDARLKARETLVKAASAYKVIRGFRKTNDQDNIRLSYAFDLLQTSQKPTTRDEAVNEVNSLVVELKKHNGVELVSAASKFLWFRYQSPVVIYDSLAYKGLKRLGFKPSPKLAKDSASWYAEYVREWKHRFELCEKDIHKACSELPEHKRFTAASDIECEVLRHLLDHGWFHERVFDVFLTTMGGLAAT